jgi:hypothetical protein
MYSNCELRVTFRGSLVAPPGCCAELQHLRIAFLGSPIIDAYIPGLKPFVLEMWNKCFWAPGLYVYTWVSLKYSYTVCGGHIDFTRILSLLRISTKSSMYGRFWSNGPMDYMTSNLLITHHLVSGLQRVELRFFAPYFSQIFLNAYFLSCENYQIQKEKLDVYFIHVQCCSPSEAGRLAGCVQTRNNHY